MLIMVIKKLGIIFDIEYKIARSTVAHQSSSNNFSHAQAFSNLPSSSLEYKTEVTRCCKIRTQNVHILQAIFFLQKRKKMISNIT